MMASSKYSVGIVVALQVNSIHLHFDGLKDSKCFFAHNAIFAISVHICICFNDFVEHNIICIEYHLTVA